MSEDESLWCGENRKYSARLADQMEHLFDRIIDAKAEVGRCLTPCRSTWYEQTPPKLFLSLIITKMIAL